MKRIVALVLLGLWAAVLPLGAHAEPSVKGWATTEGGRGGRIIRVTTLDADGPGSFARRSSARARASSCSRWAG